MNRKNERHGEFVAMLGDRLVGKYTDGGPGLNQVRRQPTHLLGAGGRFARQLARGRRPELRHFTRPRRPDPTDRGGDDVRRGSTGHIRNDYIAKRGRYAPQGE